MEEPAGAGNDPEGGVEDRRKGLALAAGGMAVLSTESLLIRLADVGPAEVVFWAGALTALVSLAVARRGAAGTLTAEVRDAGRRLLVAAICQAATAVCFVIAVSTTTVANVMVIIAAAPLAAAAAGWLVLRERTAPRVWGAMAACAAGIGVVVSGSLGGGRLVGDLFAVGAVIAFGTGAAVLRRHGGLRAPTVIGTAGVLMALVAVVPAEVGGHDAGTWAALVVMGAVAGPLARIMLAVAPRHLPVAEVALMAPLETVLATAGAFVVFGEVPGARTWIGGAVIVAGVVVGAAPRSGERTAEPAPLHRS